MTSDDVKRAQQMIADTRQVRGRELADDVRGPVTAGDRMGAPFAIGDRVFDRVRGAEGEVIDVRPSALRGEVSIYVRFDGGGISVGPARDLLPRPRPPAGRA